MKKNLLFSFMLFCGPWMASAKIPQHNPSAAHVPPTPITGCQAATAQVYLDINNVRTMILNGGDMWWDFGSARYEIPKGSGRHSIFSGALWIGGLDPGGQIHVAAMTYRQTGTDFWPGPLDTVNYSISDSVCDEYDEIYKVSRTMVEEFRLRYNDPDYSIPDAILNWPGNGNTALGQAHFLAPFTDMNGDGIYKPADGDHPAYNYSGNQNCCADLLGDQTLWWVFNDAGNIHTETQGTALGFEVHAQAFAYRTTDAINDMTFYQYKVINRSSNTYNQFWWTQWVDTDLGLYDDDFIACDVARGMGYAYNGDSDDGGNNPGCYGLKPPAVGVDFVGGPLADANDGVDNDRDSLMDEPGERIKMSKFMYYNGDFSSIGNPNTHYEFYNYMKGIWKDNTPLTYGGNGHNTGIPCDFFFPRDSDPYGWGTGGNPQPYWDETSAGNTPADRRFLMSCGPFTFQPGQVQCITIANVWARDTASSFPHSVLALQQADDLAQQAFDNCFNLPCYAPQPELLYSINGLTVLFSLEQVSGTSSSWSYFWSFGDGSTATEKFPKHTYLFHGTFPVCLTVTNDCGSATVCDTIYLEQPGPLCGPKITRIEGQGNGGLTLEFSDETLQEILRSPEHRSYYPTYKENKGPFQVVIDNPGNVIEGDYAVQFDSVSNSAYWKMYRIGTMDTVYSDTSIGAGGKQYIPQWGLWVYARQVVQPGPGAIKNGVITASMSFKDPGKQWLSGLPDKDTYHMSNWIRAGIVSDQTGNPCLASFNDFATIDPDEHFESLLGGTWSPYRLCGSKDATTYIPPAPPCYYAGPAWERFQTMAQLRELASVTIVITPDKTQWTRCPVFDLCEERVLGDWNNPNGTWQARKMDLRVASSVDKNGKTVQQTGYSNPQDPEAADFINATGMGWFPGYAVNLETGERLNMAFGENSFLVGENGRDMIWNPTSSVYDANENALFGGGHYIYVFGHNGNLPADCPMYDHGAWIRSKMNATNSSTPSDLDKRAVFADAMWVNIPLLTPGHTLLETEVKITLNVAKSYAAYATSSNPVNNNYPLYKFTISSAGMVCLPYTGTANLYPNPFSEYATLEFENPRLQAATIKIYDERGRLVRQYINVMTEKVVIHNYSLSRGMYFYTLTGVSEEPINGKFIIGD
ncbi:MAG: PKD domain-containing protein [Bacteroidota bacterium]